MSPPHEHFQRHQSGHGCFRKAYTLARETPDEAVFDMEMLDYDFHLFTEATTGQDSIVYRSNGGYRLAQLTPQPERLGPSAAPLTVSDQDAPTLSLPQAAEKLELSDLPFVFFANAETGRGNVLYHRYDGNYGLIVPAE